MAMNELVGLIGRTIFRKNPDGNLTQVEVKNYKVAEYLHSLQDHGYSLIKPMDRVDAGCVSCEG